MGKLDEDFKNINNDLNKISKKYLKLNDLNYIDIYIYKLFYGKVGNPYSFKKLEKIGADTLCIKDMAGMISPLS